MPREETIPKMETQETFEVMIPVSSRQCNSIVPTETTCNSKREEFLLGVNVNELFLHHVALLKFIQGTSIQYPALHVKYDLFDEHIVSWKEYGLLGSRK